MSDRKRRITAAILLTVSTAVILIFGLRTAGDGHTSYLASGRKPEGTEIHMPDGTVSINDADAEELTSLYGIGETLAGLIIDEREQNGPFFYPEDLTAVKGIGIRKLQGFIDAIDLD